MTSTNWFVMRHQLDGSPDSGASPDIILGGLKPDPEYAEQYGTAFSRTGNYGHINYVYVRARNAGAELGIGSLMVYAARSGRLQNQSEWIRLYTSDGRESTNIWAQAGQVGVNGVPLIWEPGEAPPPNTPWCLIAEIVGDDYPVIKVPTHMTDKASFDAWILTEPRMTYVVVQAPPVVPVKAPEFAWHRIVSLGNADATVLNASLTCTRGAAGGFLAYSFDKPDSSGRPIGVGKTPYQINAAYSQSRTVPAEFSSVVSIGYTPAADEDAEAEFAFEIYTESSGNGEAGDLGTTTKTVLASYTLSFGQTRNNPQRA